jgi:cellulose synthase/poly-beta-1,6-N-acetylglucosamine synthase-like glycosyltransferase
MSTTEIITDIIIVICMVNLVRMGIYLVGSDLYNIKIKKVTNKNRSRFTPNVTVLVPARNEQHNIIQCLDSILSSKYPKCRLKVIIINDGSTDNTRDVVRSYITKTNRDRIRLIDQKNKGKAASLNYALKRYVKSPYVMCLDADSTLDKYAIYNEIQYFREKDVVAVAANVVINEQNTLLNLVQRFEYIISYSMKRAQNAYSIEYIIGGIGSMFRTKSLLQVGYYDTNTMTEDIDLSMKFVSRGSRQNKLAYAANAIAYTESVQDVKSLISQRFRWKYGRMQTFLKNKRTFFNSNPDHSKQLTLIMLPYALVQEGLFLLEPFIILYLLYIIYEYQSFGIFIMSFGVILSYILINLWSSTSVSIKQKLILTYYAPPVYLALYALSFVEYIALLKSLVRLPSLSNSISKNNISWNSPKRRLV